MSLIVSCYPVSCAERGTWNLAFCMIFKMCVLLVEMTHCGPRGLVYAIWSSCNHHYTSTGYYKPLKQQWLSLHIIWYPISCAGRAPKTKILHFEWNMWYLFLAEMTHLADHEGLVNAIWSSSNPLYACMEGNETLKQQWVSLLVALYHISCIENALIYLHFAWNLRFDLAEMTYFGPWDACICHPKLFYSLSYI